MWSSIFYYCYVQSDNWYYLLVFHPGHNDDYPLSWSKPPFHPPTQKHRNDPDCPPDKESNLLCPVDLATVPDQTLPDIQSADYATQFLRNHSDGPFFLAVGFHKPHIPLKFPKQFLDLYPLDKIKEASNPTWYKIKCVSKRDFRRKKEKMETCSLFSSY